MAWDGVEQRAVPPRCIDHENRMAVIEKRQLEIHRSMFGQNGDITEGYVWKLTEVFRFVHGIQRMLWIAVPIGMAGAMAALWNLFRNFVQQGMIK